MTHPLPSLDTHITAFYMKLNEQKIKNWIPSYDSEASLQINLAHKLW